MKRRHHFVPQFYLRAFACAPRRIALINLARSVCFPSSSLRLQCYRHRLYGPRDDLENIFADLEDHAAPAIATIRSSQSLPALGSDAYVTLLAFTALQFLRTTAAAGRVKDSAKLVVDTAFDGRKPPGWRDDEDSAMELSLRQFPLILHSLRSLSSGLLVAPRGCRFVTSDNPVYRYNVYCEGITYRGVIGTSCAGFILFMPLSPLLTLCLYDGSVYRLGKPGRPANVVGVGDVSALNRLQFISAHSNVYFSSLEDEKALMNEWKIAAPLRRKGGHRSFVADDERDGGSSLLHSYEEMPNLRLRLSVLSIRRAARRLPLHGRVIKYRETLPAPLAPPEPYSESRKRIFRVRPPRAT